MPSTTASAICAATSVPSARRRLRGSVLWFCRSSGCSSGRATSTIGTSANSERDADRRPRTRWRTPRHRAQSRPAAAFPAECRERAPAAPRAPAADPPTAPHAASTACSTTSCRISRSATRRAPCAPPSRVRARSSGSARACPRLTAASSRIRPTAPSRISSVGRRSPVTVSCSGSTRIVWPQSAGFARSLSHRGGERGSSLVAASAVTPGCQPRERLRERAPCGSAPSDRRPSAPRRRCPARGTRSRAA